MANLSQHVSVYGLRSSDGGELRYVGQTSQPLRARLNSHLNKALKGGLRGYLSSWIVSVVRSGNQVEIFEIEAQAMRNTAEIAHIAILRAQGARLVNGTNGGEGALGVKRGPMPEEQKVKIRATKTGCKLAESHKAAIGAAQKGRQFTQEHRARISAAKKGHSVTAETRAKLSAALKGRARV